MRDRSKQRGVAAIEFGLVLPILVVILFATFEFGTAFWRKQVLTAAVNAGARVATMNRGAPGPGKTAAEKAVKDYLTNSGWDSSKAAPVATYADSAKTGTNVTVTATYPTSFRVLSRIPLGGKMAVDGSGNVILRSQVIMQVE